MITINKELNLHATTVDEFTATLRNIAEGHLRVESLITGTTSPERLPEAFAVLACPEIHAEIVVEFTH